MARAKRARQSHNRRGLRKGSVFDPWAIVGLVAVGIFIWAVGAWYMSIENGAAPNREHEHGAAADDLDHAHGGGETELPHIHGMDFSGDGRYLYVAVHDGLRAFADGEWLIPDVPKHDYMGYSPVDDGFYSSGHPAPNSSLVNPLGLVRSTDGGETLVRLGFEGESDFHLMDVGYYSHAIYVLNAQPNSRLSTGLYYSLDDGNTWQPGALQGLSAQPIAIAVHPTEANMVALATEGGLLISSDYGNTFAPVVEGSVTAASFAPDGEILLYGYQTLHAFDLDSNQTATPSIPARAGDDAIGYIAVNPAQPDIIAVATFNRHMYLAQDGGQTWSQIAENGKGIESEWD